MARGTWLVNERRTSSTTARLEVTIDLPQLENSTTVYCYVYTRRSPVGCPIRASHPVPRAPRVASALRAGSDLRHSGLCANRPQRLGQSTAASDDGTSC